VSWEETASDHFAARHDGAEAADAREVLRLLEDTRALLGERFRRLPEQEVSVVLHGTQAQLDVAQPLLPLVVRAQPVAARRYVVGRASGDTIHVLAPKALRERVTRVDGSEELLRLGPAALYGRIVVGDANPRLRCWRALRWAWLGIGAAEFFSGRTRHTRAIVARRLREGPPPAFPPAPRDASLLGGTVVDLVAREQGDAAAVAFVRDARADGATAEDALRSAFDGRALHHTEAAWRAHLARWAGEGRSLGA
jgi:hypothetical protein